MNTNRLNKKVLKIGGKVKLPSCPISTATIRTHAVTPTENPWTLIRPRIVPMAMVSSRKISGAVELIHLTVCMTAFPRCIVSVEE